MTILASDDFTRANNADLGTAWDENTGEPDAGGFNISSNTAVPTSDFDLSETNNSATWPADQYSEVTFASVGSGGGIGTGAGPTCREATGATRTYYRAVGNGSGYELGRNVTGTFTSLSSGSGTTFAAADRLRLEVRVNGANCDWILKKNGTQFASGTDTSPITSGRAGIAYSSSQTGLPSLSAWEGGDFATGGAIDDSANEWNPLEQQTEARTVSVW